MRVEIKKSIFLGIGGGLFLLFFYFLILTAANSFSHALEQFQLLRYWIAALVFGFSIQTGLYFYIRGQLAIKKAQMSQKELSVSAGISSGSMIACCAHHLVDILPFLGFSVVFLFLAKYQTFFILAGIASSVIGIIFMLEIIKKQSLFQEGSMLSSVSKLDFKKLKGNAAAVSFAVLAIFFFWIKNNDVSNDLPVDNVQSSQDTEAPIKNAAMLLPAGTNDGGGLSIEVKPVGFRYGEQIEFEIIFETHQGDLDFDLVERSFLIDDQNNKFVPLEWRGGKGGHHLSGQLIFPPVTEGIAKIKLVMEDIYEVEKRVFEWELEN